jgi:hypothetical protein
LTAAGVNDGAVEEVAVLHSDQTVRLSDATWPSPEAWLAGMAPR